MVVRKHLYNATGYVRRILSPEHAEIEFLLEGNEEHVLLKKSKFYHNARVIPSNDNLFMYLKCGTEVRFSCHLLNQSDNQPFKWIASMCWQHDQSPGLSIKVLTGIIYVLGRIHIVKKRHGVLLMNDTAGKEHKVYFLASKVYLYGKRLPASKALSSTFSEEDEVFFDAIPCIPEENEDNCKWFATCVFRGKRPDICQEDMQMHQAVKQPRYYHALQVIKTCTNNSRTMFISGRGTILEVLNEEFGIILAEFQFNIYKPVLFHRKNAFLFQMSLASSKLDEIFMEGDRVKFIAVGAPEDFIIEWVAVQVAVCDEGEYDMPKFTKANLSLNNNWDMEGVLADD